MPSPRISLVLPVIVSLQGCPVEKNDTNAVEPNVTDRDHDGWSDAEGDCDDADATTHPYADETCDGRDQDCDGLVDEGYSDIDVDGVPDCLDAETCDGRDNDGDGEIDEGFFDADADGVADCIDLSCEVTAVAAEDPQEGNACSMTVTPSVGPWDVELAWSVDGRIGVCIDRAVIADLDHDGISDILCVDGVEGITARSGLDGVRLWSWNEALFPDIDPASWIGQETPLVLADVEEDGAVDIFAMTGRCNPARLDEAGRVMWVNFDTTLGLDGMECDRRSLGMDVVDLDADGTPEVVTTRGVISTEDGRLLFPLAWDDWIYEAHDEIAVVGNGEEPLILDRDQGWSVHGDQIWSYDVPPLNDHGITPVPLQADSDSNPEVVYIEPNAIFLAEEDGEVRWEVARDEDLATDSLACAGDLDGDGEMEFVFSDAETLHAWDGDGVEEWSAPYGCGAHQVHCDCSTFDFDLDGRKEILYANEDLFLILDGASGDILFQDEHPANVADGAVPMVVDLDGDGSVEIVVPASFDELDTVMRVYRNVYRDWPPGTRIWPSVAWSGTSHNPDLTIPFTPAAPWLTTRVWRGQPETLVTGTDLRPDLVDSCISSCDGGDVGLSVRLVNRGPGEVRDGAIVTVWSFREDGSREQRANLEFPGFLDNGTASASLEVFLHWNTADVGLVLVAGDDGSGVSIDDCDLSNNEVIWLPEGCDAARPGTPAMESAASPSSSRGRGASRPVETNPPLAP